MQERFPLGATAITQRPVQAKVKTAMPESVL